MEKIVIGLCDDQPAVTEELKSLVFHYSCQTGNEVEILSFFCGEDAVESLEKLHILFLDIEMPGIDGIEVGKIFREKNKDCKIIMATGRDDRYKDAFKISAFRFVTKPFVKAEVEEALEAVFKTFIGMECIQLYENRRIYDVRQKEIECINAYDGYIEAVVRGRKMRRDISLNKLEQLLDARMFFRISRDCIINLHFVSDYQKGIAYIGNDKKIVSRRKRREFEIMFQKFDTEYRG